MLPATVTAVKFKAAPVQIGLLLEITGDAGIGCGLVASPDRRTGHPAAARLWVGDIVMDCACRSGLDGPWARHLRSGRLRPEHRGLRAHRLISRAAPREYVPRTIRPSPASLVGGPSRPGAAARSGRPAVARPARIAHCSGERRTPRRTRGAA